jgi:hypothetical protein
MAYKFTLFHGLLAYAGLLIAIQVKDNEKCTVFMMMIVKRPFTLLCYIT